MRLQQAGSVFQHAARPLVLMNERKLFCFSIVPPAGPPLSTRRHLPLAGREPRARSPAKDRELPPPGPGAFRASDANLEARVYRQSQGFSRNTKRSAPFAARRARWGILA